MESRHHLRQQLDDSYHRYPRRLRGLARRVAETQPPDQDTQTITSMKIDRACRELTLGQCVMARHQELVVDRHLGDDRARHREQLPPAKAEQADRRLAEVENLDGRFVHESPPAAGVDQPGIVAQIDRVRQTPGGPPSSRSPLPRPQPAQPRALPRTG